MVWHLQDTHWRRWDLTGYLEFHGRPDVTGEDERHVAVSDFEHEGIVITNLLSLPVRPGWMPHLNHHIAKRQLVASLQPSPADAGPTRHGSQPRERNRR